jgi:diketogulonate reductase-like aldo/keto reductase
MITDNYKLNNGVLIPKIGFGTWLVSNEDTAQFVEQALAQGYRHIDTAEAYGNEKGVGQAIKNSGIERKDIFIATKLQAEIKDYEGARQAIAESLNALDVDYIDLMLIHGPKPWDKYSEEDRYFAGNLAVWQALEEAYQTGKIKAIGVSNFEIVDLKNLLHHAKIKPMVNQILSHIGNTPLDLIKFSQKEDILVEAYSPIGHGDMFANQDVATIAAKYQVSIAQLAVRYLLQLELLPLPKASSIDHMQNNASVDFVISNEDMDQLKQIDSLRYSKDTQVFPVYRDN